MVWPPQTTSRRVFPACRKAFEARTPKGEGSIAEYSGRVTIDETDRVRRILLTPDDGSEEVAYPLTKRSRLLISDGDHVEVGQLLIQGAVDPKKVLRILGPRATQKHLVDEVQETYRSQGVDIHDKHIEVIVRQMLRRVTVLDRVTRTCCPASSPSVGVSRTRTVARSPRAASRPRAPELMGITKASLATDSWLSAASFQETTRVLTEAAMSGRSDPLLGLKENVIIGKLIPAGTGLARYRNVEVEPTEEAKAELYPSFGYDEIDFPPLGMGSGEAIPLEDLDFGDLR